MRRSFEELADKELASGRPIRKSLLELGRARRPVRFRGDSEVDDAALDADHRGVGAVVSTELRQYTSDPALDGLFGE